MKKIDWKDILIRAVKTFLEAALAYMIATMQNGLDFSKAVILGALAAGITALLNYFYALLKNDTASDD